MAININEPQFWRMQLHPARQDSQEIKEYTDLCLESRRIGLDFEMDGVGDLRNVNREDLGEQKNYYGFYELMDFGDIVLIAINRPYALVQVVGEYKYSVEPDRAEVWCPHHRKVNLLAYFDDWKDELPPADKLHTSKAIQPILDTTGDFYKFVKAWLELIK